MSTPIFLRCRSCNELCRLVPQVVGYGWAGDFPPDPVEYARDSWPGFLRCHDGHALESLAPVRGPELVASSDVASELRILWQVTNGSERLLVEGRGWDKGKCQLEYRVVTVEPITQADVSVVLREDLFRRQLDQVFFPHVLPLARVERYLEAIGEIIAVVGTGGFEKSTEGPGPRVVPTESLLGKIRDCARRIFDDYESRLVCRHIEVIAGGGLESPLTLRSQKSGETLPLPLDGLASP